MQRPKGKPGKHHQKHSPNEKPYLFDGLPGCNRHHHQGHHCDDELYADGSIGLGQKNVLDHTDVTGARGQEVRAGD